jgi:aminomethyltransferase
MTHDANTPLAHVPLDSLHRELGAKMAGFAGWDMPIQYPAGLKAEHLHTRTKAGLFDVSHMGQLAITARDGRLDTLQQQLEAALPIDFEGWPPGLQRYSMLLNDQGGIEDDLMLVNLGDQVRMVVNAGNREHDLALLRALCPELDIHWVDAALVALQGPLAQAALERLDPGCADMLFMQSRTLSLLGAECFTTRSGYTGEDGYEISLPREQAQAIVRRLLDDPTVAPIGLGARDTLRLEAGLPLHGNDISPSVTPIEAGLGFAIPKSRRAGGQKAGGFPGAQALLRQIADGAHRKLVGLSSYDPVPVRPHAQIVDSQDKVVGEVTSGTVSPSLGRPVMLAMLDAEVIRESGNTTLKAVVRDRRPVVHLTPLPFVAKRYKR